MGNYYRPFHFYINVLHETRRSHENGDLIKFDQVGDVTEAGAKNGRRHEKLGQMTTSSHRISLISLEVATDPRCFLPISSVSSDPYVCHGSAWIHRPKPPVLDPHQSTINIRIRHGSIIAYHSLKIPQLPALKGRGASHSDRSSRCCELEALDL